VQEEEVERRRCRRKARKHSRRWRRRRRTRWCIVSLFALVVLVLFWFLPV
jgi:type VI protein secretion system component VasF